MRVILSPGLQAEVVQTVTEAMTAIQVGSGSVRVFATPLLIALLEQAATLALEGALDPGQTTVGVRVDVQHLAPTPVGGTVRAVAALREVDGRRLVFVVEAWDDVEQISQGTHERVIVDQARFEARAAAKVE